MRRIRLSYLALVAISFVLNGWALLQHLSMVPAHDGFIAAIFLANMLSTPLVVWAAFVFGEIAQGARSPRRLRTRSMAENG